MFISCGAHPSDGPFAVPPHGRGGRSEKGARAPVLRPGVGGLVLDRQAAPAHTATVAAVSPRCPPQHHGGVEGGYVWALPLMLSHPPKRAPQSGRCTEQPHGRPTAAGAGGGGGSASHRRTASWVRVRSHANAAVFHRVSYVPNPPAHRTMGHRQRMVPPGPAATHFERAGVKGTRGTSRTVRSAGAPHRTAKGLPWDRKVAELSLEPAQPEHKVAQGGRWQCLGRPPTVRPAQPPPPPPCLIRCAALWSSDRHHWAVLIPFGRAHSLRPCSPASAVLTRFGRAHPLRPCSSALAAALRSPGGIHRLEHRGSPGRRSGGGGSVDSMRWVQPKPCQRGGNSVVRGALRRGNRRTGTMPPPPPCESQRPDCRTGPCTGGGVGGPRCGRGMFEGGGVCVLGPAEPPPPPGPLPCTPMPPPEVQMQGNTMGHPMDRLRRGQERTREGNT